MFPASLSDHSQPETNLQLTAGLSRAVKTGEEERTRATRTSANSSSRRRAKVRDDDERAGRC